MHYLCPLCLEELDPAKQKSTLLRFCRAHPEHTAFVRLLPDNPSAIFCPGTHMNARCNDDNVEHAPLLLHSGCTQVNPFWDAERSQVVVPDRLTYQDLGREIRHPLDHWQIEAMRAVPEQFRHHKAMWFPQALFRAVNEVTDDGQRTSTVLLMGGSRAGKSVLATMALRPETWHSPVEGGGYFDTKGYVYVSPRPAGQRELISSDFVDSLAALVRDDGELIGETSDSQRNIRGLFLRYEQPPHPQEGATDESAEVQIFNPRKLKNAAETIAAIMGFQGKSQRNSPLGMNPPPPTVIFYDLKGETMKQVSGSQINLIQSLDRIAIVMSAADLSVFSGGIEKPPGLSNSVEVATAVLGRVTSGMDKPVSLVVTHIDEVRGSSTPEEWAAYWRPYNNRIEDYAPSDSLAERGILWNVLNRGTRNERGLAQLLERRTNCSVRFVWTEEVTSRHRYAVGIHSFVSDWCFPGARTHGAGSRER